jgi:hypothetical protein
MGIFKKGAPVVVPSRTNNRSLGDTDIIADSDFFVVNKPDFLANPAVIANR